jgi:chromosome segregation ATPase
MSLKSLHNVSLIIFSLYLLFFPPFSFAQEESLDKETLTVDKLTRQKELLRTRVYELFQENKDIRDQLKKLQDQTTKFDDIAAEKELTIQNLFAEKDDLVGEITKLQEEKEKLSTSLEEKQTIIRAGRNQIEKDYALKTSALEEEKKQKDASIKALQIELEEKNKEIEKIKNEVKKQKDDTTKDLQAQLEQKNKDIKVIEAELKNVTSQADQKSDIKEELEKKNAFLVTKIVALEDDLKKRKQQEDEEKEQALRKVRENYESTIRRLEKELAENKQEIEGYKKDVHKTMDEQAKILKEKAEAENKSTQLVEKISRLEEERKKELALVAQDDQVQLEKIQKEYEGKIGSLKKEMVNHDELEELRAEKEMLEKENVHLKESAARIQQVPQSDDREVALKEVRLPLEHEINVLKNQLKEKDELITETKKQQVQTLKSKLKALENENAGYASSRKDMQSELTKLKGDKEKLLKDLAAFSSQYQTLETKFEDMSKKYSQSDAGFIDEIAKAKKPLEEANAVLVKRVGDLTKMVEESSGKMTDLVDKARNAEIEREAADKKSKQLEDQLAQLNKSTKQEINDIKTPLEGKVLFLEGQLKQKTDGESDELKKVKEQLRIVKDDLAKKTAVADELSGLTKNSEGQFTALKNENAKLKTDLETANSLLRETEGFLAKRIAEVKKPLEEEINRLKSQPAAH